jgi:hypothetical protein
MLKSKKYVWVLPPQPRSNDPPQLTEAVTTAHETSDTFSNETLREQATFQFAKEAEMKEMLSNLADGQIELYRNVSSYFLLSVVMLFTQARPWRNGTESFRLFSAYAWTFSTFCFYIFL